MKHKLVTCAEVGYPKTIRVDGSEFISRDLNLWAYANDVILDFSRPGKPTDNAYIESFNGSFRNECLNTHWFVSLDDAREKLEAWRSGRGRWLSRRHAAASTERVINPIRMNQKKLRRLCREEKLQDRKRGGRKRALGTRRAMVLPSRPNERWSLDFVSESFIDGRRFRVLAVVDDYRRECLALVGRVTVLFRSFKRFTCLKGDYGWQTNIVTTSNEMQFG